MIDRQLIDSQVSDPVGIHPGTANWLPQPFSNKPSVIVNKTLVQETPSLPLTF